MRYSYIIFYHRILPETLSIFEWQIKVIKNSMKIIDISEIEDIKDNSIIITFDDGFFDNYVFAYPILKKYQVKATIFITTRFIKSGFKRKNLVDYWKGYVNLNELMSNEEYLTWDEIVDMNKTGLINIQAHSHNHYSHFTSNYFVNYKQRRIRNLNVKWNKNSSYKIEGLFKGFEYLPDEKRFETEEEREKRLSPEFLLPKRLIKDYLGYDPIHFCWPWGDYDEYSINLGQKFGYKFFYTTEKGVICKNINYNRIPRISTSFNKLTFLKRHLLYSNKIFAKIFRLC